MGHPGTSTLLLLTHRQGCHTPLAPLATCLFSPLPSLWPPDSPALLWASLPVVLVSISASCSLCHSLFLPVFLSVPVSPALWGCLSLCPFLWLSSLPLQHPLWPVARRDPPRPPTCIEPCTSGYARSGFEDRINKALRGRSHLTWAAEDSAQAPAGTSGRRHNPRVPHARPRPRPSPPPSSVAPSLCAASNGRLSARLPRKLFSRTSVIGGVPLCRGIDGGREGVTGPGAAASRPRSIIFGSIIGLGEEAGEGRGGTFQSQEGARGRGARGEAEPRLDGGVRGRRRPDPHCCRAPHPPGLPPLPRLRLGTTSAFCC